MTTFFEVNIEPFQRQVLHRNKKVLSVYLLVPADRHITKV